MSMRWQTPSLLWLLWLLPIVGWLLYRAQQKRALAAQTFASGKMRTRLVPRFSSFRTWVKALLLLAGIAAAIVAVARPKYGVYYEQVAQHGVDLFVLLDVSRSMLAEDIAPNRLERAKSDIVDLLARIPTDRVGLIVFAGRAVPRIPLTNDHTFYRQMLRDVDSDSAPIGGSLIGDAIRSGLAAMPHRSDRDQVMVLITDGEDHDSFPLDAAKMAADRGVKIITVGLGDTGDGARIPEQSPQAGFGFLKDKEGKEVWSRMDEQLLKKIALETSGAYVPARTMAYDLGQIYDDHLSGLTRSETRSEKRKRFREQFQWFTALALALLVGESLLGRAKLTVGLLACCFVLPAGSARANDADTQTREGLKAFEDGEFAQAAELFGKAAKGAPDDPRLVFNRACALAASETPEAARDLFFESALSRDVTLSADSHYNLGCMASDQARAVLPEDPISATKEQRTESLELFHQAMGHFRDALAADPEHVDSRHNLETLRLWVKQIKALWQQRDREQNLANKNAVELLKEMDKRQLAQRTLLSEEVPKPGSPSRTQQIRDVREQQLLLADDVEPFRQKLLEEHVATVTDPQVAESMEQGINQTAEALRSSMESSAGRIASAKFDVALSEQRQTLETMDLAYGAIAPYQDVLQRSIPEQESRLGESKERIKAANSSPVSDVDLDELSWRQQRVQRWASFLYAKASEQLPMLEQMVEEAAAVSVDPSIPDPTNSTPNPNSAGPKPIPSKPSASKRSASKRSASKRSASKRSASKRSASKRSAVPPSQQPLSQQEIDEQVQPLIDSMTKAVDLAPQVETLADEAAVLLEKGQLESALPKQEEALKLLKEIADGLPKNENQNQGDQNSNQDNSNQDNPNEDNTDQDNTDQDDSNEKAPEQSGDENQQGDQNQQGKQGQQNEQNPDGQNDERQQQDSGEQESDSSQTDEPKGDQADEPKDDSNADEDTGQSDDGSDEERPQPESKEDDTDSDDTDSDGTDSDGSPSEEQSALDAKSGGADKNRDAALGKQTLSPARVESILQRVRDRERQYRQVQRQLRNLLRQRQKTERDW